MNIRLAVQEDLLRISALYCQVVQTSLATFTTSGKSLAQWEEVLRGGAPVLVAEENGQVLGYATYGSFRGGPGYQATAEHSIYLDAAAQGRGIGRALLLALEGHAAEAGRRVMVAAISGANPGAMQFHAACGYVETARMPQVGQKWGQWLDLVLMQKNLQPGDVLPADRGSNAS